MVETEIVVCIPILNEPGPWYFSTFRLECPVFKSNGLHVPTTAYKCKKKNRVQIDDVHLVRQLPSFECIIIKIAKKIQTRHFRDFL